MNVAELLEGAARLPSPSGSEAEVAAFLVASMQEFCDAAHVDAAGNAVGQIGSGPLRVYVLGHIDTVPGEVPVRVEDGNLYGRGTVDAKGPFCTAVAAAAGLSDDAKRKLSVMLIGAVEEEAPSSRGARYALESLPKPDLLIIGEPSGWDALTLGYKGRLVVRLALTKANFHSAGDNTTAAEDLVACWGALKTWADGAPTVGVATDSGTGIFDRLQIALQSLNTESDGLTQRAEAVVGLRLPPAYPPERAEEELRNVLESFVVTATFSGHERACRGPKDTPLTRAFRVAIRAAGGTVRFKVKTGTSDMNVVTPVWDVPVLAYGPGDSALDHTPNEHVALAELDKAVAVFRAALEHLAKMSRAGMP